MCNRFRFRLRWCPATPWRMPGSSGWRGQTSAAVRGLGNNPANDALESSVGVFLDNVYLGRPGMANVDLFDLEQVALLRGPQGTLFGKNTTAGVLNLQTRLPTFQPEYRFEASGGNYGFSQVRAS